MFHGNNTYHLWKKNTDYTDAPSAAATSRFRELTFANCCRSRFVVAYHHLSIQSNAQAAAGAARRRREARSDSSLEQAFGLRRRERRVALSVWSVFFLNTLRVICSFPLSNNELLVPSGHRLPSKSANQSPE